MTALTDLFPPDHFFTLRAADQAAVASALARRAGVALGVPAATVAAALAAREALGSTGVGHGVAIPHARLPGLTTMLALFARLERPVDWRAIDGRPVDLVFLLLSPVEDGGGHLAAQAAVTRRLREAGVAGAIRTAKTTEAGRAALVG